MRQHFVPPTRPAGRFVRRAGAVRILLAGVVLLLAALPIAARGQGSGDRVPAATERVKLSGPRFGATVLGGAIRDSLRAHDITGGVTARSGALNIPLSLAVVPSSVGMRVSVLTGFTMR